MIITPPFRSLKHAIIEPLIIEKEKLDELKNTLADPKIAEVRKSFVMSRITGHCLVCGKMPSHIAKYRMFGVIKIEKYCDECLERAKH